MIGQLFIAMEFNVDPLKTYAAPPLRSHQSAWAALPIEWRAVLRHVCDGRVGECRGAWQNYRNEKLRFCL
ncbi:hypothetical protein L0337_38385 [candidate division KSB1 bacterium]|nr:hypothetical protein [candidate division KSB1 bacterium]